MSKMINPKELSEIVTRLLVGDMTAEQLDDQARYSSFLDGIAQVVADHCGGDVSSVSFDKEAEDPDSKWLIGISSNESLPDDGGVWAEYDPEGEL